MHQAKKIIRLTALKWGCRFYLSRAWCRKSKVKIFHNNLELKMINYKND